MVVLYPMAPTHRSLCFLSIYTAYLIPGALWQKVDETKRVEQHLDVFAFSVGCSVKKSSHEHIWIWVPLIPISKNHHRNKGDKADRLYDPVLQPGFALMFDARHRSNVPKVGEV